MDDANAAIKWSAYDHESPAKGSDWYWALGIIAVCFALTSILFHNVLFGILIVMGAITMALASREAPKLAEIEISDRGIRIDNKMHHLDEILSFWVEEKAHDGRPHLLVDTKRIFSPNLIIPIEHTQPSLVRAFLKERVKEVRMNEPVSHRLLAFFGF